MLKPKSALTGLMAAVGLFILAVPLQARAQQTPDPGEGLYNTHCAACHDHPDATRAPPKSTLRSLPPDAVNFALTEGKMKAQGSGLSAAERSQLIH